MVGAFRMRVARNGDDASFKIRKPIFNDLRMKKRTNKNQARIQNWTPIVNVFRNERKESRYTNDRFREIFMDLPVVFGRTNFVVCFSLLFVFFLFVQFNVYNMNLLIFGFSNKPIHKKRKKNSTHKSTLRKRRKKRSQFEEQRRKKNVTTRMNTPMQRNKNVNDFLPLLFLISAFHQSFLFERSKKKSGTILWAHFMRMSVCMNGFRKYIVILSLSLVSVCGNLCAPYNNNNNSSSSLKNTKPICVEKNTTKTTTTTANIVRTKWIFWLQTANATQNTAHKHFCIVCVSLSFSMILISYGVSIVHLCCLMKKIRRKRLKLQRKVAREREREKE